MQPTLIREYCVSQIQIYNVCWRVRTKHNHVPIVLYAYIILLYSYFVQYIYCKIAAKAGELLFMKWSTY